ncbi:MAG TPA: restriction endonuclease subunit S, partial [Paludibacter sp.]
PRISNFAPVGPISRNHLDSGVMSPLYSIFRFTKGNLDFIEWFFSTTIWHKHMEDIANYGARADRMSFTIGDFYKMPISFPTLPEQSKIAEFLSAVNEKLQAVKNKKNLLEEYIKGVMQKLFTQELRFIDDNAEYFAEWKVNTLMEIGETYNGLSGKSKEDFGVGKPYVQYKQVFDDTKIDISRFEFVQINKNEKQNKVEYGDILFTTSSETPNEVGMSSVLLDNIEELYLNSFCFGYRPYSLEVLNPNYARFLFRSELFRKEVVLLAQGSTRYNLSKLEMIKLKISLPTLPEQTKIANFLSSIDNKIMECSEQIEKIECWKKGLLQKMFC